MTDGWYVSFLVTYNCAGELFRHSEAGSRPAQHALMRMLGEQGRVDEAKSFLRQHPHYADELAKELARHLGEHGHVGEAIEFYRQYVDRPGFDEPFGRDQLVRLYELQGATDKAIAMWHELAAAGNWLAKSSLADLLANCGRTDEAAAIWQDQAGDYPAYRLADLLIRQGRAEEAMTVWQERSGPHPRSVLEARLLLKQDRIDEAIATLGRKDVGSFDIDFWEFPTLLIERGYPEEAITLLRRSVGNRSDDARLVEFLVKHGRTTELDEEVAAGTFGAAAALLGVSKK